MAGQALRVDLGRTRAMLRASGIKPVFASGDLICLGPADALGGYMLFYAPSLSDPWGAVAAA